MKVLHDGDGNGKIVLRNSDGTILILTDGYIRMKQIPGRKRSEKKTMEWNDLLVLNDAIKIIYPDYTRPVEEIPDDVDIE